jgi:DNA segregation ATPase FtsK/SpoIIIE-like protein
MSNDKRTCPECDGSWTRRDFVKTVGGAALAVSAIPLSGGIRTAAAAPTSKSAAETAAKRLYESLTDEQRKVICFPFDNPLRQKINANWAITEPKIAQLFTKEQQATVDEIFRGVTSPDGYERFLKQMEEDAGGLDQYHVALFGDPGSGKFEFEMTGRHMTIRADGDSVENVAFGGPIIYGHGQGDGEAGLPGNVFYYQTKKANEVFAALDGKQREKALLPKAPPENQVSVQGAAAAFPGIAVGELSSDQKNLVEETIKVILAPYRQEDVDEAVAILKADGGFEKLHAAFYQSGNLGNDQEWDIWRLEGPGFVWHFRGSPHVHAYVNIAKPKSA